MYIEGVEGTYKSAPSLLSKSVNNIRSCANMKPLFNPAVLFTAKTVPGARKELSKKC